MVLRTLQVHCALEVARQRADADSSERDTSSPDESNTSSSSQLVASFRSVLAATGGAISLAWIARMLVPLLEKGLLMLPH